MCKKCTGEMRLCFVGKDRTKAIFHRWVEMAQVVPPSMMTGGHGGGEVKDTYALVEYENGVVRKEEAYLIVFADSVELIKELEKERRQP